ncbi:MAG TPA: 16S rRNA (cytidine(1402)-2'-O)-methyltransferase [Cyanobacteria bacterium UBA8156]|nr:16S rRNA (cytidine(1402)-2'-O)-methyltransferase [Cyanobacteria bacterium UBA8156]
MALGTLYLVGTPIGNLEDMTFRAIAVLQRVALIAAEDTRHTGKLLQHFQIDTPQISYRDENHRVCAPLLLSRLQAGQDVALVSDAGMPLLSDPGEPLVAECIAAGIAVVPVPGPTAAIAALVASGLAGDRFVFEGFLPLKAKVREARLTALAREERTVILYEAPHRLRQTLQDLQTVVAGDRPLVLARELTKRYEEFWRGTLAGAIAHYAHQEPKGEFVLILGGHPHPQEVWEEEAVRLALARLLQEGQSLAIASRELALTVGRSRREIYQLGLQLQTDGDG